MPGVLQTPQYRTTVLSIFWTLAESFKNLRNKRSDVGSQGVQPNIEPPAFMLLTNETP